MTDKAYIVKNKEPNIEGLEETINQIHESNNKLKESGISIYKNEIDVLLENFKKSNKKYKRKIKTCFLSLIASLSISVAATKSLNLIPIEDVMYKTTEYIYYDDSVTQNEKRGNFNNILIKEYGYWNEEGTERTNKIYDVSEYTFDDIKNYLNIDLSNLEYDNEADFIENNNTFRDMTNEGEKILIKNVSEKDFSFGMLFRYCFLISYLYVFVYIIFCSITILINQKEIKKINNERNKSKFKSDYMFEDFYDNYLCSIIGSYDLKSYFLPFSAGIYKKIKNINLETLNRYYEEIKEPLTEILNEIEKNSALRDEFVRLFNENVYLLNDPNLLMEKYNEVLNEYDLLTDKNYFDDTAVKLKRILNNK